MSRLTLQSGLERAEGPRNAERESVVIRDQGKIPVVVEISLRYLRWHGVAWSRPSIVNGDALGRLLV